MKTSEDARKNDGREKEGGAISFRRGKTNDDCALFTLSCQILQKLKVVIVYLRLVHCQLFRGSSRSGRLVHHIQVFDNDAKSGQYSV